MDYYRKDMYGNMIVKTEPFSPPKEKYIVTLFWANKKDPDVIYTDELNTNTIMRPGIYLADGLVVCIKENPSHVKP